MFRRIHLWVAQLAFSVKTLLKICLHRNKFLQILYHGNPIKILSVSDQLTGQSRKLLLTKHCDKSELIIITISNLYGNWQIISFLEFVSTLTSSLANKKVSTIQLISVHRLLANLLCLLFKTCVFFFSIVCSHSFC